MQNEVKIIEKNMIVFSFSKIMRFKLALIYKHLINDSQQKSDIDNAAHKSNTRERAVVITELKEQSQHASCHPKPHQPSGQAFHAVSSIAQHLRCRLKGQTNQANQTESLNKERNELAHDAQNKQTPAHCAKENQIRPKVVPLPEITPQISNQKKEKKIKNKK
jgi:hypothetical protein